MSQRYEGRLELTWTNKDKTLLAHEDGPYEWVPPSDYRVAEVRLLHEVATVGDVGPEKRRTTDNLLIRGDALHALQALNRISEFAAEYQGMVRLVYIDPPFNTGQAFEHYDDNLEHSVWLTMLRDRLEQMKSLLAPNGSVWLHLDDAEVHRARCVLDEVMGSENFVGTIIWEKTTSGRNDALHFSTDQDYILVYALNTDAFRPRRVPHTQDSAYSNPDNDHRGPWREVDYKGPKSAEERPNLFYPLKHPATGQEVWPRRERVWAYGRPEYERHLRENLLWWGKTQNYRYPKLKKFLSERSVEGTPPRTLWLGGEVDTTRRAKTEVKSLFPGQIPFATPKPEKLMERIIRFATDPGDVVLDCFAGSGTTAAVAQKMGRRWVAVEWSAETVANFTLPRLEKVVAGEDPGGVTKTTGWTGGGGFRVLDVGPSMFQEVDGRVFLADWATNGALAEATAAQLGYEFDPEGPFCGRKGRVRLAVVDGLVNEGVVRILVDLLDVGERLSVCGTAVDPAGRQILRQLRPGSTLKKVPAALIDEYRQSSADRSKLTQVLDWQAASALLAEFGADVKPSTGAANATGVTA